ncbi:cell division protein FtsQ/DivIB [Virgibacillus sp. W0181]|uniref:cell division protein FtsQ/DivIB n=1 Tax=Virgibacillus sp. W0181 TaxID=3391581 RepID=UPI003F456543
MKEKKVVSIEDRIPKLKQARKKKANRRLIFYLSIFFILISIIVYLQSPLSHIKQIQVKGNEFVSKDEVIASSKLTTKTNIWTIDRSKIEKEIGQNDVIKSVEVMRKLPWTVEIQLHEHGHIGYIKEKGLYHPVLENGEALKSTSKSVIGDAPLLSDFNDKKFLLQLAKELNQLPDSIIRLISEISWQPTEKNKNKIILYMNDGYTVDGTIRDFANKMKAYPSIVAQLEPGEEGIIHIGVGSYFEKTGSEEKKKETEEALDESS